MSVVHICVSETGARSRIYSQVQMVEGSTVLSKEPYSLWDYSLFLKAKSNEGLALV